MSDKSTNYLSELPADIGPFKELLQGYSHIPPEEVESHIYKIREKAWAIAPYPGFGLWGFTRIRLFANDPRYQIVISRLTVPESQDRLLDVGCGLGQNIRQLILAGVSPARLSAVDLHPELLDIGFELFRDRERIEDATFFVGDVLKKDNNNAELQKLDGKVTMIHAANFFHLFPWDEQVSAGIRMTELFDPDQKDCFIFGRHVGSLEPGARTASTLSEELFLHDERSFQKLWDEIGGKTETRWKVEVDVLGKMPPGYAYLGEAARYCRFVVWPSIGSQI